MANESIQDPLAELRDIHLPAPPELWPPAPGWWLLLFLGIAAAIYLLFIGYRYWQSNAYRRQALRELDEIYQGESADELHLLTQTNDLLKRVALTTYGRESVANLTGEGWVAFLDASAEVHDFSMGPGQALIDGPYVAPGRQGQFPPTELYELSKLWIRKHKRDLSQATTTQSLEDQAA